MILLNFYRTQVCLAETSDEEQNVIAKEHCILTKYTRNKLSPSRT